MIKYQVIVHANIDQILDEIRNRLNPEYQKWTSREFDTLEEANHYAMMARVASGQEVSIKEKDPDQYKSVRDRVAHILRKCE